MRRIVEIVTVLALLLSTPAIASCRLHPRERIVLYGAGDDPDVLLWDSQFRLRAYGVATFDEAHAMLPRAIFVHAGTRAVVIRCLGGFLQAPYGLGLDDAVDVRVLSGPQRGVTGWIAGSDAKAAF